MINSVLIDYYMPVCCLVVAIGINAVNYINVEYIMAYHPLPSDICFSGLVII